MDFFELQDSVRRRSRLLLPFFVGAVLAVVGCVYAACITVVSLTHALLHETLLPLWNPRVLLWSAVVTVGGILSASLIRLRRLELNGGHTVGRILGGVRLDPSTNQLEERRLLNVIEEMALAAGLPVPAVYLLEEEPRINAFAAGRTPDDAVIGVTAGALRMLSRDELQGLVAHQFGHIQSGDLRINLRLMGWLDGLLVVSLLGKRAMTVPPLGILLMAIGGVGLSFARIVRSGYSRQRNLLADATAAQLTRQPSAVSGALKKVGATVLQGRLENPLAEAVAHLLFVNGLSESWFRPFASHPSIEERVRSLEPLWDGVLPEVRRSPVQAGGRAPVPMHAVMEMVKAAAAGRRTPSLRIEPGEPQREGSLTPDRLQLVHELLLDLPDGLERAAREPATAGPLIYALLLSDDPAVRGRQVGDLRSRLEDREYALVLSHSEQLGGLGHAADSIKLPLVDLVVPALRQRSPAQYRQFLEDLGSLIEAHGVHLFSLTLRRMVERRLDPHFGRRRRAHIQYYGLGRLGRELSVLLSKAARVDGDDNASPLLAAAQSVLVGHGVELQSLPHSQCGWEQVDGALRKLALLAPRLKTVVLEAVTAEVIQDQKVSVRELELVRAIADSLGSPIPPFLLPVRQEHVLPTPS